MFVLFTNGKQNWKRDIKSEGVYRLIPVLRFCITWCIFAYESAKFNWWVIKISNLPKERGSGNENGKEQKPNNWIQKLHAGVYRDDHLMIVIFSNKPRQAEFFYFSLQRKSHTTKFESLWLASRPTSRGQTFSLSFWHLMQSWDTKLTNYN